MRRKINKTSVDELKPGEILADTEIKGFTARRLPSGVVTFGLRYRVGGRQRWYALGSGGVAPDQARRLAFKKRGEVADDRDPAGEREAKRAKAANTVNAMLDAFLDRHVRKNLHTAGEVERAFDRYVRPRIGTKPLDEFGRLDVVEMLDAIEDENGPVMADRTLAYVRKACNWQAVRDPTFVPPIVRGMGRTRPGERARDRVLDDQEIRDLWTALDKVKVTSPYPALVRTPLLTGQRLREVAGMRWEEINGNVWTIPTERRRKGGANAVPLTDAVVALLGAPQKNGFVFTSTGNVPFSGFSGSKERLDAVIANLRKADGREPMPEWCIHDLRRTARTLMSRLGVSTDIGERAVGHVKGGVRGVYDHHPYLDEKRVALQQLANLVGRIIDPLSNVIALDTRSKHR